jgi:WD40 repeat protein
VAVPVVVSGVSECFNCWFTTLECTFLSRAASLDCFNRCVAYVGTVEREYCTVGDDGYLRVWSLSQHRQLACVALPGMARACDYSPDGLYLVVGFGGRVGKKSTGGVDGLVKIFRFDRPKPGSSAPFAVTQVSEIKDAKQWISCVRFSPDGCTLAVGSRDNSIYLYSVLHQYERKGKFSKHNSGINQLDFSLDGKYIQSNCR